VQVKPVRKEVSKLNPEWVLQTKNEFLDFLQSTKVPHPVRNGRRGSSFDYPEWLIMFIAVLAVKCHEQTYLGIHRLALEYWHLITPQPDLPPISESQLRERLKKSATRLEDLQLLYFRSFLQKHSLKQVSADKMMIQAKGPLWHQKQKRQGIVPPRLRGLDKDATWSFSQTDGWVYGHGSFCLTSHRRPGFPPLLGRFVWMPNSAHEGKRLLQEMPPYRKLVQTICMDSKADDLSLYNQLRCECSMQLLTAPRAAAKKNVERQQMIRRMNQRLNRSIYRQRSTTVEPMQANPCRLLSRISSPWNAAGCEGTRAIVGSLQPFAAICSHLQPWELPYKSLNERP
jgi:hypothetical protein